MIKIERREDCCGCRGCVQVCPKECISFGEDQEGFRYPKVDLERCIECNLCERVCPVLHPGGAAEDANEVYAAINQNDDIRQESSSGGFFTALAVQVIEDGGVVFGARFDENWEVRHDYVESKEGLTKFRGSKYLQSRIGTAYKDAQAFLKEGRRVLFTGTPCQIAGLKRYLRRDYDNLIAVDFICHGVPSPKVWRKYLEGLAQNGLIVNDSVDDITKIGFREKMPSWILSKIVVRSRGGDYVSQKDEDPYFSSFLKNVTLRPICYECPFKCGRSGSDLTMADFWGIKQADSEMFDDRGTSMIISHNDRIKFPENVHIKKEDKSIIGQYNNAYYKSAEYNGNRKVFFGLMNKSRNIIALMKRCTNPTLLQRVQNKLYRILHK